jgi:crossover junction endodeoxyribonuclease RuvC
MRMVLGIDPGLASTGFGVVTEHGSRLQVVDFGVIQTDAGSADGARLLKVYKSLRDIIATYDCSGAGIESLYQSKNVTSAIRVAQARGVVLLALAQAEIPAAEYTPQMIKQAVVGAGNADKGQVQRMVQVILGLDRPPTPDHAADAVAAAITYLHSVPANGRKTVPGE